MKKLFWDVAQVFWDTTDKFLYALILLIILDYLTGVCVAVHQKKLSSEIGAKGIAKKVGILILVSMTHIADTFLFDSISPLQSMTATFYIANEGISIIENVGKLNLPLPEKIKELLNYFEKLKTSK